MISPTYLPPRDWPDDCEPLLLPEDPPLEDPAPDELALLVELPLVDGRARLSLA
jgi:hypothetical protein